MFSDVIQLKQDNWNEIDKSFFINTELCHGVARNPNSNSHFEIEVSIFYGVVLSINIVDCMSFVVANYNGRENIKLKK